MALEDHAKVERDGFKVPLLGIPPNAGMQECESCQAEYPLRDVEMTATGQALCTKCRSEMPAAQAHGSEYVYVSNRHHQPHEWKHESVQAAIGDAIASMSGDEDWPVEIRKNSEALWHCGGPMDTRESLKAFAAANGVEWKSDE